VVSSQNGKIVRYDIGKAKDIAGFAVGFEFRGSTLKGTLRLPKRLQALAHVGGINKGESEMANEPTKETLPHELSQNEYDVDFPGLESAGANSDTTYSASLLTKREKALEHALDIRKFEIELYWKRASYFWTFIGATFAGYAAIQTLNDIDTRNDLSVLLSCLGLLLSFGWFCANKASKRWQENWENHVDLLEDGITGPLYKTLVSKPAPDKLFQKIKWAISGPAELSVSKINQLISLFVTLMWLLILWRSLPPFSTKVGINLSYVIEIAITILFCGLFMWCGRTDLKPRELVAIRRSSKIAAIPENEKTPAPN
jgi:hypothetical protein